MNIIQSKKKVPKSISKRNKKENNTIPDVPFISNRIYDLQTTTFNIIHFMVDAHDFSPRRCYPDQKKS